MRIRMSELRALIREAAYTVAEFDDGRFDQALDEVDRLVMLDRRGLRDPSHIALEAVAKFYTREYARRVAEFVEIAAGYRPIDPSDLRDAVAAAMSELEEFE